MKEIIGKAAGKILGKTAAKIAGGVILGAAAVKIVDSLTDKEDGDPQSNREAPPPRAAITSHTQKMYILRNGNRYKLGKMQFL